MKKVLLIVGVLAALGAVAALLLVGNLGSIVKGVVETVGSDATRAPVTLENADISLTDGKGTLTNLVVGNPESFESQYAMSLGEITVDIDTSTLGSNPIVINEIVIQAPQVIYEVGLGTTNIGTIQSNVEAYAASLGAGGGSDPASGETDAGEGTKVIIKHVYIRDTRIAVSASFLGGGDAGATIPLIELQDLGKSDGGATAGEVAARVLDAISDAVIDTVADLDIEGMAEALKGQGEGLLNSVGDGIGSLFGGDDDDEEDE